MPSSVPDAAPARAPSADTAPPPDPRRPDRPAAATTLPPSAPAGRNCRPCCGRSGEWLRSPGGSGRVRTSAGVHLESCAWITFSGPPFSSSLRDLLRGSKNGSLHQVIQHPSPPARRASRTRPTEGAPKVDGIRRNRWSTCVGISTPSACANESGPKWGGEGAHPADSARSGNHRVTSSRSVRAAFTQ